MKTKVDTLYMVFDKNDNYVNSFYGIDELSKFLNRTIENTKQTMYRLKHKKDKTIRALGTTLTIYTEQEFFKKEKVVK